MRWTPAMLDTLYLEANAINRWRGWNEVARVVSCKHCCTVSASAARKAYDRSCDKAKRQVGEG